MVILQILCENYLIAFLNQFLMIEELLSLIVLYD